MVGAKASSWRRGRAREIRQVCAEGDPIRGDDPGHLRCGSGLGVSRASPRGAIGEGSSMSASCKRRNWALLGSLLVLVLVQALILRGLFAPGEPFGEDLSIHFAETAQLARAFVERDFSLWNFSANLGFPSGYYYQVLPQAVPALAKLVLGNDIPLLLLFKICISLPVLLLPVSCYLALVALELPRPAAVGGATAAGLAFGLSSWGLGIDSLFTAGLYTQAWGMLFSPVAVAYSSRFLTTGNHLGVATLLVLLTGLCHPFVGFCLFFVVPIVPWWRRGVRAGLARVGILAASALAASAFFWLPILVHYDSFGGFPTRLPSESGLAPKTFLTLLLAGKLLDNGRLPVLTALLVPAAVVAVRQGSASLVRLGLHGALFGLLITIGPAFGKAPDDLLPAIRFLAPMQLSLALLAGAGAVLAAQSILLRGSRVRRALAGARAASAVGVFVYLVATAAQYSAERVRTITHSPFFHRDDLERMMGALATRPPGRVLTGSALGTGSHWWMYLPTAYLGYPGVRAYGGAALQSSPNFASLRALAIGSDVASLFGVRYVIARSDRLFRAPAGRFVSASGRYVLREIAGASLFAPVRVTGLISEDRKSVV